MGNKTNILILIIITIALTQTATALTKDANADSVPVGALNTAFGSTTYKGETFKIKPAKNYWTKTAYLKAIQIVTSTNGNNSDVTVTLWDTNASGHPTTVLSCADTNTGSIDTQAYDDYNFTTQVGCIVYQDRNYMIGIAASGSPATNDHILGIDTTNFYPLGRNQTSADSGGTWTEVFGQDAFFRAWFQEIGGANFTINKITDFNSQRTDINAIYDFNNTTDMNGHFYRDANWLIDSEVVHTICLNDICNQDLNLHYTNFNQLKDYNISLIIKAQDGNITQKDQTLSINDIAIGTLNINFNTSVDWNLTHTTGGFGGTGTNINIDQEDLGLGKVQITFNDQNQYFEFINERQEDINVTLNKLTGLTDDFLIIVKSLTGSSVENVRVRASILNFDTNQYIIIGQRITDTSGQAIFKARNTDHIKIEAEKDNETQTILALGQDLVGTTNFITIYLGQNDINAQTAATSFTLQSYIWYTIPTMIKVITSGTHFKTYCHTKLENGTQTNQTCTCFKTTITTDVNFNNCQTSTVSPNINYDANLTNKDINYTIRVTEDGYTIIDHKFQYDANKNSTDINMLSGQTGRNRIEQYFPMLLITIIIAGIIEMALGQGILTFFALTIFLSMTNITFAPQAILGALWLLADMLNGYLEG